MSRFWLLALAMWFSKAWAQTATPAVLAEEPPVFHGAPMSMHFQSIDLRTALQLVAEFSGVNIIMSDNVTGQLTMRLQDVPWDQVLHTILQTRGLGQQQTGNVIWVAPQAELSAREKTRLETRHAIQVVEPLQTRAYALNYAKAAELLPTLLQPQAGLTNAASPRLLSPRGSAMADLRTNQLFVTDIADRLDQVARLIERVDVPQRQVLIEARIVEALDNFAASLGVRLSTQEQG